MSKSGRPVKLQTFIARQLSNGADALTLFRAQPNGAAGAKLERFRVEGNSDPEGVADAIEAVAQGDADTLGQKMAYVLRATHGTEHLGQHSLVFLPADDDESGSAALEPVGTTGQLAQLMRHNEALVRMNIAMSHEMIAQSSKMAEFYQSAVETMRQGWTEGLEARAELATRNGETDIKREIEIAEMELKVRAQEKKEKLVNEVIEIVKPMLPAIGMKLLGPPTDPPTGGKSGN